jgi:hypothetical protein
MASFRLQVHGEENTNVLLRVELQADSAFRIVANFTSASRVWRSRLSNTRDLLRPTIQPMVSPANSRETKEFREFGPPGFNLPLI